MIKNTDELMKSTRDKLFKYNTMEGEMMIDRAIVELEGIGYRANKVIDNKKTKIIYMYSPDRKFRWMVLFYGTHRGFFYPQVRKTNRPGYASFGSRVTSEDIIGITRGKVKHPFQG